ncbi:hypothetical protein [Paenibacillus brasilensis]|uniref:Uncharacterized protein n=1 Tax=Paenibacillus brasilensis TaxID=128574 RepID=A0ABU0L6G4_9BACL|nr:hypothetical protein [Paenibacillus brasilensis]MDQ0496885.1 hypothetical protein [Paenibacillus brasilensis]
MERYILEITEVERRGLLNALSERQNAMKEMLYPECPDEETDTDLELLLVLMTELELAEELERKLKLL